MFIYYSIKDNPIKTNLNIQARLSIKNHILKIPLKSNLKTTNKL